MSITIVQSSGPAVERLVDEIVELIQERELQIGDQLPPIRELAKLWDQKATAIRDALLQAQALGVVRILPRAGAFVQQTPLKSNGEMTAGLSGDLESLLDDDEPNLFHLLDARRVIELELGSRVIERRQIEDLLPLRQTLEAMTQIPVLERRSNYVDLDIQFHLQLARLGGNQVLAIVLETILQRLRPYLERLLWDEERRLKTDRLHAELYQALVDGDEEEFCARLREHQRSAYECLLSQVRTSPVACIR